MKKILTHHDRMLAAFFRTIYYVVTSWSGNEQKIYLQRSKQSDLQGDPQASMLGYACLQVLGGEDLFSKRKMIFSLKVGAVLF
jgi:hypothetical protein